MSTGEERTFSSRQRAEVVSGPIAAAAAIGATAAQPELQTELQPLVEPLRAIWARIYNVRDFAAKGDGKLLDSAAVQAAIDACAGEHGGTVLVPAGTFLIGPIELKKQRHAPHRRGRDAAVRPMPRSITRPVAFRSKAIIP